MTRRPNFSCSATGLGSIWYSKPSDLRHDVTDDELSEADRILDDVWKSAEINEPRALSRHGRLLAVVNIRKIQRAMYRHDNGGQNGSTEEYINPINSYIISAFHGLIQAHNSVCELDTVELKQALSLKMLLENASPFRELHRQKLKHVQFCIFPSTKK